VQDEEILCRVCWSFETDGVNPLLRVCKCSGTVAFIHLNCLREWMTCKKQERITPTYASYYWRAFECELCKSALPLSIKVDGEILNLFSFDRPESSYLVLSSLIQDGSTQRIIHVIKPSAACNTFLLGRGQESDLRINDISVSRMHAKVKY
jgi:E3 ubiquitin-protein ligase DOA10